MACSNELLHLRLLRDDLGDLDIEDIQDELIDRQIFTRADCEQLLAEVNLDHRLDLMFTILEHKLHSGKIMIVKDFLSVLEPFYRWIVEKHEEELKKGKTSSIKKNSPIDKYLSYQTNSNIPNIDELNVYRRKDLWQIQKCLKELKHGVRGRRYLFVEGGFGTGKWTLVSQACENYSIVHRMGFKIFYLNLANCNAPEQTLELLENLSIQMETDYKSDDITYNGRYPTNEIQLRIRKLRQRIEDKFPSCLLVLSHVRDPKLIKDFDLKCKTLVITSNKDVIASVNVTERLVHTLGRGFTENESMELFGKALRLKSDHLPKEAHDIHHTCRGNPFVIKLIARKMSEYGSAYDNASDATVVGIWCKLAHDLKSQSITIENMTIKSILEQLSPEEQEAFRSLVIFRDNVKIPQVVLQRYWALSAAETETRATKLINKGLLDKRYWKDQQIFYVLHYVCYSFLLKENPNDKHANLHRRLVESYRIEEAMNNRRELDLLQFFPNDNYFHFYIANHLEKSQMFPLFSNLFLDFGFLEQKLRYTGLPNTVGDLRLYQKHIFVQERDPESYAETLHDFLMSVEVLLSKSADTCLLQLALNCRGLIAEKAETQALRYNNRVWFCDIDHTHQHQLVQVPKPPIKVRFQNTSSALVSLDNNQISMVDLSPWYSAPVTIFDGNQGSVQLMHIANKMLVALDEAGSVNVWSMKNVPSDRNARQHESDSWNVRLRSQNLRPQDPSDRFSSFCIVKKKTPPDSCEMFAITEKGGLYIYNGFNTFTEHTRFNTKISKTYIMKPLIDDPLRIPKILLLTENNIGVIFNLSSTSVEHSFEEHRVINVHYIRNALISVSSNQIRLRRLKRNNRNQLESSNPEVIYNTPSQHRITCSAISDDSLYVILGTTQGISIFSIRDQCEVLRTNISHSILDVDIHPLDDDQFRYMLISSSEDSGNVINMYSLMVTPAKQLISNQFQLQGSSSFLADLDHQPVTIKTVDRKRIIQELQYGVFPDRDDFCQSTQLVENKPLTSELKRCVQSRSGFYVGLKNGKVLRLSQWANPGDGTEPENVLALGKAITVLKYYDDLQVLVAATEDNCIVRFEEDADIEIKEEVCECYLHKDQYLVLVYEHCAVEILNVETKQIEFRLGQSLTYGASVCDEQYLIICTTNGAIYQLGFKADENETPFLQELHVYAPPENIPLRRISSCALSANGELLAVGYKHGAIEVYSMDEHRLIATLDSHKAAVASLYFSPWKDPNCPHILVSVGEQIAFWNLDYVINNPRLDSTDFKRRSNRYKSRSALNSPAMDIRRTSMGSSGVASPLAASPARNGSLIFDFNEAGRHWLGKTGPSDKPHLLSCIKLIGSTQKLTFNGDFSKFFTIDDEGYLYYLRLYEPGRDCSKLAPPNGSSLLI
ncbi:uncharacterized protein LOC128734743 [Sabethes cyaneus]|uniref:uncharacterized protein LOC128734743 n=1 Tax=Sabethes cyaneus TaxID=53552 RepID=UPI00237DC82E|nr:uncharacterized protein LOC128734743 [Sabethes cyaneus]